jgi:hypothetical protein
MYMDEIFHYSQTLSFHQGKHFQPKLQSEPFPAQTSERTSSLVATVRVRAQN